MDEILALIKDYGQVAYIFLFLYCALKSGLLPLFAGYAAFAGALDISLVLLATFAGGYLGDELRFAVGRRYGASLFNNRPRFRSLLDAAKTLIDRYGAAYIFVYRYPKGLRTVGALPVGLTEMPWLKFSALNAASAATWTIALVGAGYLFGATIEKTIADYWGQISFALLLLFAFVTFIAWQFSSRAKAKTQ